MAHIDPTFTTSTSCQHSADEVSQFIVTEAGWNTPAAAVTFFFDIPGLEVVTAADESEPDLLAATAMAVPTFAPVAPSGLAYFVFNVVVAKRQRRQGLARRIVSELIALCERRGATEVRLISSLMGRHLYNRLDFAPVPAWALCYVTRFGGGTYTPHRVVSASPAHMAAALRLEACADASDRRDKPGLTVQSGTTCFVITDPSSVDVVAAVWMTSLLSDVANGAPAAWIGPVVAQSSELAREVLDGATALYSEMQRGRRVKEYALVLQSGARGASLDMFKEAGFEDMLERPIMRRVLSGPADPMRVPGRLLYAVSGWLGS